jgi:hypothetical protein
MENYMKKFLYILAVVLSTALVTAQTGIRVASIYDQEETGGSYTVIAGWNAVPFQRVNSEFKLGVVAFHETGANVYFRINGGIEIEVKEPSYNSRTDTWEYWISINPSHFPDGPVYIDARAVPDAGSHSQKILPTFLLYANSGNSLGSSKIITLSPGQDIQAAIKSAGDGGTVRLLAGTHVLKRNTIGNQDYKYWTTIEPAPGVNRSEVRIRTSDDDSQSADGDFDQNRLKLRNIQLYQDKASDSTYSAVVHDTHGNHVWVDSCEIYDARGGLTGVMGEGFYFKNSKLYLTNSLVRDIVNGKSGIYNRNIEYLNIGSDIFRAADNLIAVNISITNMHPFSGAHPDLIQFYNPGNPVDNLIIYNLKALSMNSQGIFGADGGARNLAFVNWLIEKDAVNNFKTQMGTMEHVLMWHITTVNHEARMGPPESMKAFSIRNCSFHSLTAGPVNSLEASVIRNNHYRIKIWDQDAGYMGSDWTEGDPAYADEAGKNFRPGSFSPLRNTGVPLECVPADVNGAPWTPGAPSIGALRYQ